MEYQLGNWKLDELLPMKKEETTKLVENFETYREVLTESISPETFRRILNDYQIILQNIYEIMGYAELKFSENTQDPAAMAMIGQNEEYYTGLSTRIMFFDLWWKSVSDAKSEELIAACPENEYYLRNARQTKPYTLSEAEERIISIKDMTGASALNNIYAAITNRYSFSLPESGEDKPLTRGELMIYARSEKKELREAAYKELYRLYGNDSVILAEIYQNIVRDWDQECLGLRHYQSPISARNIGNDIPDEVVDLLLKTCQKNKNIFIRYFKLKKEVLGIPEMHRYDLYAPISEDKRTISFDDAMKTVLAAYREFDPDFAEMAESVYKAGHINSEVKPGKRGGAFCETLGPNHTPWVLVNFQGKMEDCATLAHELGHAIHSISAEDKTILQQHACLPLAETASTFGEMILSDYLQKKETNKNILINMLMKQLDDNYATIQRQAYFALFEKTAHRMISEGTDAEALNNAYLENLRDQFGDSMVVDDYFKYEWISIPHIYNTPFYVYAYAFGQLLVLSLYRKYQEEGSAFIPKYKEMLHTGGSKEPAQVLKEAGFDFYSEEFWQGGFDALQQKLNDLEELLKTK